MSALTKIFIVLQLVCSLALAVLIALMVSKLDNYKEQNKNLVVQVVAQQALLAKSQSDAATASDRVSSISTELNNALAANKASAAAAEARLAQVQTRLDKAESDAAQLNATIASANSTASLQATLLAEKDRELNDLRPRVADLTKKYAEMTRTANDQKNALAQAEMAIRKLQEQIVTLESQPKTSTAAQAAAAPAALTGGTQTPVTVNGRITKIGETAGKPQIEVPLGTRDGLQVNTKLVVYRESAPGKSIYLGEALVQRVDPNQAVAVITFTKPGETVQAGDLVMSGLGQ